MNVGLWCVFRVAVSVVAVGGALSGSVLAQGAAPSAAPSAVPAESEISFQSGALTLRGTLALPSGRGPWPGVVIIAGSGPTDRNGNSPAGIGANTYAMLARALAERGIASLRYDKRGLPSSTGAFDMPTTTLHDFAADAAAAARALDARDDVGAVMLAGHSEGGTLAMLAARAGAPVRGLVLVATAGRGVTTILREQLARQLPPDMLAQFDTAWAGYIAEGGTYTAPALLQGLFAPVNRRFMQSWNALDPVALLRSLPLATLVVQGETDVQITPADARALGSARADVTVVLLPGVNHVLKEASGATALAQASSYSDASLPLGPGVVSAIADWVLATAR